MKDYVYVIVENGSWGYEVTNNVTVFKNFKSAKKEFDELVKQTKDDMENWADEEDLEIEENVDIDKEYASFSMFESGDYSRLHSDITLEKYEVMEV